METKQTGWVIIIVMALTLLFFAGFILWPGISEKESFMFFILIPVLIIPALLFYQLKIHIDYSEVKISFGIGLIRKSWELKKIEQVSVVKNNVFHGWGIHYALNTTIYNVSGFNAVELKFKNSKRKVRIGTNEPEKVAAFINQIIAKNL
ncbi:MAG: hypothetical protein HGA37_08830 [Lentimicrobium sp.]|nr:hypothetical protein [Lentimicrobium sp.]